MNDKKLKQGDKVTCNGFSGSVVREYNENMYEVRLQSGLVCVDKSAIKLKTCVWCKRSVLDTRGNNKCCAPDGDGHLFK